MSRNWIRASWLLQHDAQRAAALTQAAVSIRMFFKPFSNLEGLTGQADQMIENVIGVFGLPLGIATNFQVNGRDVLIPMVIEEPSVVAGASFMAKLAREGGGFLAETEPEMIGQIQVVGLPIRSWPPIDC